MTYESIRKIATSQGDNYTTSCLLDYTCFGDICKMIAIDADPKAIQQISFTANLERAGNAKIFLILEGAKETILDFSQGTAKLL